MTEEWRKIQGFLNYSVSSGGAVRNDKTGRILSLSLSVSPMGTCALCEGGKVHPVRVSTLLRKAFPEIYGEYIDKGMGGWRLSHDERGRIKAMRSEGASLAIIAEKFGVSESMVSLLSRGKRCAT